VIYAKNNISGKDNKENNLHMDEIDPVNQDREDILLTHTAKNILFFPEDDIYGWVHNIEKI